MGYYENLIIADLINKSAAARTLNDQLRGGITTAETQYSLLQQQFNVANTTQQPYTFAATTDDTAGTVPRVAYYIAGGVFALLCVLFICLFACVLFICSVIVAV